MRHGRRWRRRQAREASRTAALPEAAGPRLHSTPAAALRLLLQPPTSPPPPACLPATPHPPLLPAEEHRELVRRCLRTVLNAGYSPMSFFAKDFAKYFYLAELLSLVDLSLVSGRVGLAGGLAGWRAVLLK